MSTYGGSNNERFPLTPGAACWINGRGDLYMDSDVREFFNVRLEVVKVCKSGLVQVRKASDPKKVYSVPQKNVDLESQHEGLEHQSPR